MFDLFPMRIRMAFAESENGVGLQSLDLPLSACLP
jgi:hypothetical protein